MAKFPIDYLIANEDNIDWESLSSDKENHFNLTEIKLFKRKIVWQNYLVNHKDEISSDELEEASKVFSPRDFDVAVIFNVCGEDFILKHKDEVDFAFVITFCKLSPDALQECRPYWIKLPDRKRLFQEARNIDLTKPEYADVRLALELS